MYGYITIAMHKCLQVDALVIGTATFSDRDAGEGESCDAKETNSNDMGEAVSDEAIFSRIGDMGNMFDWGLFCGNGKRLDGGVVSFTFTSLLGEASVAARTEGSP